MKDREKQKKKEWLEKKRSVTIFKKKKKKKAERCRNKKNSMGMKLKKKQNKTKYNKCIEEANSAHSLWFLRETRFDFYFLKLFIIEIGKGRKECIKKNFFSKYKFEWVIKIF